MFVTVVTAVAVVNRGDGVIVAGVKVLRGLATGCRRYRRRTGNWAFVVSPTSGRAAMPGKRNPRISSACAKPGCSINDRPFYGNEVIAQLPYLLGVSSRPIGGGDRNRRRATVIPSASRPLEDRRNMWVPPMPEALALPATAVPGLPSND